MQIVQVPNRNVTLSYPDEVTPEQIQAHIKELYPRNGSDVALDLAAHGPDSWTPSFEDFKKYDAYTASQSEGKGLVSNAIDFIGAVGPAVKGVFNTLVNGAYSGAKLAINGEFEKGANSLIEGAVQGAANPILSAVNSTDPSSPFFKIRSLMTGTGTQEERYVQFLAARDWKNAIKRAEEGKEGVFFKEGQYDPEVAQASGLLLDAVTIAGGANAALRGAGIISKTSRVLSVADQLVQKGSRAAEMAADVAGGAETASRYANYIFDWKRAAGDYASSVTKAAGEAAGKIIDTNPEAAAKILQEAEAHAQQVTSLAERGSNWVNYATSQAAKAGIIGEMFGHGHIEPLIAKALSVGGDNATKFFEAFAGVAKESAQYMAADGPGQISSLERVATMGSTAGRRKLAEALVKYGPSQGAMDVLKPAVASTLFGGLIGSGLAYGSEGTAEAAGAGFGSGAVLGAIGTALHAAPISKEARANRITNDFVKDLAKRPDTISFWNPVETTVIDPNGTATGTMTNFQQVNVADKAARVKMADTYSPDNLARVMNVTNMAEQAGAKVVFHGDDFSAPQVNGSKYNGVTVHTGPDGTPTIFLNVDRMKPSTASHEVWHAFESDEFNKVVREHLFGDLSQFNPSNFAQSEVGKQFSKFVTEYSNKLPNGSAWRDKVFSALGNEHMAAADRAVALSDAVSEFGAYYFENWIQGKHPDVALKGKIPNVWSTALQRAKQSLFRTFGAEAAMAHGASIDPVTGTFYKDGKRIAVAGLDELSQRFIQDGKNPRVGTAISSDYVPLPQQPEPAGGMLNGDWTKRITGPVIEAEVIPPAIPRLEPTGTSWSRNERKNVEDRIAEFKAQRNNQPIEVPVRDQQPAPEKVVQVAAEKPTQGAPPFSEKPSRTLVDLQPIEVPAGEAPHIAEATIANSSHIAPRSFDDALRHENGWIQVDHQWLAGKKENPNAKRGDKKKLQAALAERIYTPVFEQMKQLPVGSNGEHPVKLIVPGDENVKNGVYPGNQTNTVGPVVFVEKPEMVHVQAIANMKDPQTGKPLYTSEQVGALRQMVADRMAGRTSIIDGNAERLDLSTRDNESRVYYPFLGKEVVVTGIFSNGTSAPKVGVIDLTHIRTNINRQLNDPEMRARIGFKGNSDLAKLDSQLIQSYIPKYLENLSSTASIPSADLFGGGKRGAFIRDVLRRALQIDRKGNVPINPTVEPLERVSSKTQSGKQGREHGVPFQWVRIDRLVRAQEGKPLKYDNRTAYKKALANFQPADSIKEPIGGGSVTTDRRTGFRLVSKDGKNQRLFRPDGTLFGIFSSEAEAIQALDKHTSKQ